MTAPRKSAKKSAKSVRLAPPSPRSGVRLPVGAHPGNTGGKKGRSGRLPDEFREKLAKIRDEKGLPVLESILDGVVKYIPKGVCPNCGFETREKKDALISEIPSHSDRLRAVDMTMKYTTPLHIEGSFTLEDILSASRVIPDHLSEE